MKTKKSISSLEPSGWISSIDPRVGVKVRDARKQIGLSQAELGARLGDSFRSQPFSQALISDIERGITKPSPELVDKLAAILEKPLAFFETGIVDAETHEKAHENFRRWKKTVMLPESFPRLTEITDDQLERGEKIYIGLPHRDRIQEILRRARGTHLVAVQVPSGHGCTTISRHIFLDVRKWSTMRALIPVHISLTRIRDRRPMLRALEEGMRREIVRNLVTEPWDEVLDPRAYADLIGAVDAPRNRHQQCMAIRASLGEDGAAPDWEEVKSYSPMLGAPIDELLATLSQRYGIRVSLLIDMSSDRRDVTTVEDEESHAKSIVAFQQAMKTLHERDLRLPRPTLPSVLNEIYFTTPETYSHLKGNWARTYVELDWPEYRRVDVFAILIMHYAGHKLSDVIDDALLEGISGRAFPLRETVRLLEARLLDFMNDWEQVPYRIAPGYAYRAGGCSPDK